MNSWGCLNSGEHVYGNRARIFKRLWSPGIDSKEWIPPAYLLAGRYDNPIRPRFLAPIDCLKIPAQKSTKFSYQSPNFLTFKDLWNQFRQPTVCSLAGWYDK
jgi:hypothetical protein